MRVLLTAFEPYDQWPTNSSWLTLVELLKERPAGGSLVTRLYPVDLELLQSRLRKDLDQNYDAILHLGQSPGASAIKLEAFAINAAGLVDDRGEELGEIVPHGPAAYRSRMPVGRWARLLRDASVPASVSYHAGTYLCNAIMYLTHYYLDATGLEPLSNITRETNRCPVGFLHLPLCTEQVAKHGQTFPSLPLSVMKRALEVVLNDLELQQQQQVA